MAYFNALYAWPSLSALTQSGPFSGTILEGQIVSVDPADGLFKLQGLHANLGATAVAGRNFQIAFYSSTDSDIATTTADAAAFPNSLLVQNAAGISGGNLATLSLPQDLEAETDQYVGTPALHTELTVYGVGASDSVVANAGKLRAAVAGEPVVAKVTKAAAALKENAAITVLTVRFGFNYIKA